MNLEQMLLEFQDTLDSQLAVHSHSGGRVSPPIAKSTSVATIEISVNYDITTA